MKPSGSSLLLVNAADQVLLVLRDDTPKIPYPNMWDLPGGYVEPGETPEECIVREIKEEMGLDIPPPILFRVTEFLDRIEYTFWLRVDLSINEIRLTEGQRVRWFSKAEVREITLACQFNRTVEAFLERRPWMEATR